MAGNSFGHLFRISTFGESHGTAIGVVIDGCPAGLHIDLDFLQKEMRRRKPGQSTLTSPRNESDEVEILSGVFDGISTGTPIALLIKNSDAKSSDYEHLKDVYRPSHADFTYQVKYGRRDHRGGGRSSARETAARVAAGAVAKQVLAENGIKLSAWVSAVGEVEWAGEPDSAQIDAIELSLVRCPDKQASALMESEIEKVKQSGDSLGGIISLRINGVPPGLGEPVFDKLEADLAKAMLSINAVKGFELGGGFAMSRMKGSQVNDSFIQSNHQIRTSSNYSGGIQGGISNGAQIACRVAFKPVATIKQKQLTVNTNGEEVHLEAQGRHDPCVVPRAVPIVEAMAALVLCDHLLRNRAAKI